MEPTLTRRALAIFEEALDVDVAGRGAFLDKACAGDSALLAETRRLLKADVLAERAMPTGGLQPQDAPMPTRIGRYRIVERLGQGGMGDVFVGARDDGLFEHAVAIKRIRPSLFPETARILFDRERRALAALSHRHIAQLYDGGVDETGAPYLIMELVRGVVIDDYVLSQDLSPRRIVEMMIAICEAVQHAHQNLIVHADLKPANILVNDAGDPKVVDFGVARLMREGDDAALHPQTPGYSSPHRMAGAAPTPADDVFALGAVLRALLTGEAPRGPAPTLLTSQAIGRSPAFSGRPASWRAERARAVHGDLDTIILRACAAAPEDRYPAAVALAADLRAWLDIRPIAARTADRLYVFQKFVRRRRWRVVVGAVAALSLVAGLMVTSLLYAQADYARREAEARFTEVRSLAKYLLYDVYDRLERTPQTLAMRSDVARVAQAYLNQLADTPSAPRDVLLEAADGLVRVADLQAGRSRANLGEVDAALENLQRADAITVQLLQRDKEQAALALSAGIAIRRAALAMNSSQDLDAAARLLDEADTRISDIPEDQRRRSVLATQLAYEKAILANWKGAYADGEAHARQAVDLASSLPPQPADARDVHYLLARALDALAEAIYYGGSEAESEPVYRRLADLTSAYAAAHPDDMLGIRIAIEARWALGVTLLSINRSGEGLVQLDAASALLPELLQYQPDDDGARRTQRVVLGARAQALAMTGRFAEGVGLLREQVSIAAESARANPLPVSVRSHAITLLMLADLYADNRMNAEACPLYTEAEDIFTDLDRQGQLSQLDRDSSQRMVKERQAAHCR